MEIKIENPKQNARYILRRLGYKPWKDPRSREESYIKRMGRGYYPRFHVKIKQSANLLIIDLHFDARRPMHKVGIRSYEDEESPVVRQEADRIKSML